MPLSTAAAGGGSSGLAWTQARRCGGKARSAMPQLDRTRIEASDAARGSRPRSALTTQAVHGKPLKLLNGNLAVGQCAVHGERRLGAVRLGRLRPRQHLGHAHGARRQEGGHGGPRCCCCCCFGSCRRCRTLRQLQPGRLPDAPAAFLGLVDQPSLWRLRGEQEEGRDDLNGSPGNRSKARGEGLALPERTSGDRGTNAALAVWPRSEPPARCWQAAGTARPTVSGRSTPSRSISAF